MSKAKPIRHTVVPPLPHDVTTGGFLTIWLDTLAGTITPATHRHYRDIVRLYVGPHVGRIRLSALQPRDVTAMVRALDEAGKAGNTQRLARSILRRALRWGHDEALVARNVAAITAGVRLDDARQGRALTDDEARALLASIQGHRLVGAFVALSLALRLGELLALEWADVCLDDITPRVTVAVALKRTESGLIVEGLKPRGVRTMLLPTPTAEALCRHRAVQAAERLAASESWLARPLGRDLVFRTELGAAIDPANFRHLVYRLTEEAGLGRCSPHDLRRSAPALVVAQGDVLVGTAGFEPTTP